MKMKKIRIVDMMVEHKKMSKGKIAEIISHKLYRDVSEAENAIRTSISAVERRLPRHATRYSRGGQFIYISVDSGRYERQKSTRNPLVANNSRSRKPRKQKMKMRKE